MSNSFGGIKVDENSKANFEIDSNLEVTNYHFLAK